MKKLIIVASLICFAFLTGCDEREAGTFVSVSGCPSLTFGRPKSAVTTTRGVFIVFGSASGMVGEPVVLKRGIFVWCLYIGDSKRGHEVVGY